MDRNAELDPTLQGVLENHALPADLSRTVATKAFAERFGSVLPHHGASSHPAVTSLPWLLVAALVGVLIGYTVLPAQGGITNQLMMAQLSGGRSSGAGSSLAVLSSTILPASMGTFRVLFLVFLILFVTRCKVWADVFPQGRPLGLIVSQWLALLAALFGVVRLFLGGFTLSAIVMGDFTSLGRRGASAGESIVGTTLLIDQIWWLTFWIAALSILFWLFSLGAQSYWSPQARVKQQGSKTVS